MGVAALSVRRLLLVPRCSPSPPPAATSYHHLDFSHLSPKEVPWWYLLFVADAHKVFFAIGR